MGSLIHYPVDMHMHSCCSDGLYSPKELAQLAAKLKLKALALCDHDTLSGIDAMRAAVTETDHPSLRFLPAVELSCGIEAEVHILGYGVSPSCSELENELKAAAMRRKNRMGKMLELVRGQGILLAQDAMERLLQPGTGRAHLAREMVKAGAVASMKQAFDQYLGKGKPCYQSMEKLTAAEAVKLLKRAGAVPVLAHPVRIRLEAEMRLALMEGLAKEGLMGIEAYHPSADRTQAAVLEKWARRNGLLVTGGSDFHGDNNTTVFMGKMPSGWTLWQEDVQALFSACGQ